MGLIRIILFVAAGIAIYGLFRKLFPGSGREDPKEEERLGRLVQDPNCNVYVDSKEAVRRKVPDGDLFFCSEECAEEFFEKAKHGA